MLRSYGLQCCRVVLAVDMEREADMQKLFKTVIAPIEQRPAALPLLKLIISISRRQSAP